MKKLSFFLTLLLAQSLANAQSTIVVSKKAQSEISPGVDFGFTSTIPSGANFTLNDDPSFVAMQDVGVGANNTVWAVAATATTPDNGQVYYRPAGATNWIAAPGAGVRVDVYNNGTPMLTNAQGYMFIWNGSAFVPTTASPIAALDIGISAGTVQSAYLLAGAGAAPGCQSLWRWDGGANYSGFANICGTRLDVAPDGTVYVLNAATGVLNHVQVTGGTATILASYPAPGFLDVTVAADGTVWGVNTGQSYRLIGSTWVLDPNSSGLGVGPNYGGISAGLDGDTPIVTNYSAFDAGLTRRGRLIQRREDGGWMNDHTVHPSGTANSIIYNVAPGTYTVTENTEPASWELIKINTSGGSVLTDIPARTATVTIAAGQTVHLEFVNYNIQSSIISNSCGTPYIETFGTSGSAALSVAPTIYSPYHYNELGAETYNLINNFSGLYNGTPGLDHTPGDTGGYFLHVNGGYGQDEVFRRRFSGLLPGATYSLSLWATNLTTSPGYVVPNLVLEARNPLAALISSTSTGDIPFTVDSDWRQYNLSFTADASGTVDFIIRNNQQTPGVYGNDFAIDDITIGIGCDYGDAPDSYSTTIATNGPSHKVTTFLTLGSSIDADPNGTASTDAAGDNGSGSDDENGVSSFPEIQGGSTTTVTNYTVNLSLVNITGSSANVCGWIDWNSNGVFDASEGVCTTAASGTGAATLTWPTAALSGATGTTGVYARFRITTDALTTGSVNGAAENGEVEDYFIPFQAPLPVTLVSFEARKTEASSILTWVTSAETNSDHFEIQRSTDSKTWKGIGAVNAQGDSKGKKEYSYTDNLPEDGENLYRLRMVDKDGTFAYSRVRSVRFEGQGNIVAYPNPTSDKLFIKDFSKVAKLRILDLNGRTVHQSKVTEDGEVNVNKLTGGLYILEITWSNGSKTTQKVLIRK
ncbi:T9SS type A sorting domain-containing protein [Dyadobacter sp. MSC1_007]|uniref:T9SS type A sorting domain-containing protein n=1 Tax=Dyadobacter sp. MSC1_007 TaxID=2909264 RepID=UPI00202F7713|nr:T9SS type A sorting domain-containing protein [Dyadobacter sp. MSC1_007]